MEHTAALVFTHVDRKRLPDDILSHGIHHIHPSYVQTTTAAAPLMPAAVPRILGAGIFASAGIQLP